MNSDASSAAEKAAQFIKKRANCHIENRFHHRKLEKGPIGLILGTGWGDAISFEAKAAIPFREIPGFESLGSLEGHARKVLIGSFAGRQVIVLQGRVHINEAPADKAIYRMVRLQTEMLFALGVHEIIVTSAAGNLERDEKFSQSGPAVLPIGSIAVIDGFVTAYAPEMPLWAGEFISPEDAISQRLNKIAESFSNENLLCIPAGYLMVRGPFFEGRKYDKQLFAQTGAGVIGMSTLPEACVASMFKGEFLGLSFVTNSFSEIHSHAENQKRVKAASAFLGNLLHHVISKM